jgi:hypothetical protein
LLKQNTTVLLFVFVLQIRFTKSLLMKKITLLTAVLFFAILSHAQITKGSTMIGGSVGANSNQEDDDDQNRKGKNNQWGAGIDVGRFFANNKAVGLFLNYNHGLSKTEISGSFPYSTESEFNSWGGGFYYRQYFPLSAKWYLFGQADLGYANYVAENKLDGKRTSKTKGWNTAVSITPGVSFAAGRKLFIESSFSDLFDVHYGKSKGKDYSPTGTVIGTSKGKSFGVHGNLSGLNNIYFGLRWILPGKGK